MTPSVAIFIVSVFIFSAFASAVEVNPKWKRIALYGIRDAIDTRKFFLERLNRDPRLTLKSLRRGLDFPDFGNEPSLQAEAYYRELSDSEVQVRARHLNSVHSKVISALEQQSARISADKCDPTEFGFYFHLHLGKIYHDDLIEWAITRIMSDLNSFIDLIASDRTAAKEQMESDFFKSAFSVMNQEYLLSLIKSAFIARDFEKTAWWIREVISTLKMHLCELRDVRLSTQYKGKFLQLAQLLNVTFALNQNLPTVIHARCQGQYDEYMAKKILFTPWRLSIFGRFLRRVFNRISKILREIEKASAVDFLYSSRFRTHRVLILALSYPKAFYDVNSELDQTLPAILAPAYKGNKVSAYNKLIEDLNKIKEKMGKDYQLSMADIYLVLNLNNEIFPRSIFPSYKIIPKSI